MGIEHCSGRCEEDQGREREADWPYSTPDVQKIVLVRELAEPNTLINWRNQVYDTCRQQLPISMEHHLKWLETQEQDDSVEFFGISNGHQIVGTAGLTAIDNRANHAEYSLLIGPPFQGKGYAFPALMKLLEVGFQSLNLNLIWGEIMTHNEAGVHIAKKMGFKYAGTLRDRYYKGGIYRSSYIYEIKKWEWIYANNVHF